MNCSDMALEIGLSSKRLPVTAIISCAYKGVDVDIVKMVFEKLDGPMSSLRSTTVPCTLLRRLPRAADVMSVLFYMEFGFF
jgi:hypothetical protein